MRATSRLVACALVAAARGRPTVADVAARERRDGRPLVAVLLGGPLAHRGFAPRPEELDRAILAPLAASCGVAIFVAADRPGAEADWRGALGAVRSDVAVVAEFVDGGRSGWRTPPEFQWGHIALAQGLMRRHEGAGAAFAYVAKARVDLSYHNVLDAAALLAVPDGAVAACSKQFQSWLPSRTLEVADAGTTVRLAKWPSVPDQFLAGPRASVDALLAAAGFYGDAAALDAVRRTYGPLRPRGGALSTEELLGGFVFAANLSVVVVELQLGRFASSKEAAAARWLAPPCAACFDADRGGPRAPRAAGNRPVEWVTPRRVESNPPPRR